jgi:hypothetical protein
MVNGQFCTLAVVSAVSIGQEVGWALQEEEEEDGDEESVVPAGNRLLGHLVHNLNIKSVLTELSL